MRSRSLPVLFLSVTLLALPQIGLAQAANAIQVDVDHASFAYSDTESLVEIYLAFEAATLDYQSTADGFLASLPVDLSVYRSSDISLEGTPTDPIWHDEVSLSFALADTTGLREGQHFLHQVRLPAPPGEYELRLGVEGDDATGRVPVELRKDILVPDFTAAEHVNVSDVTLAVAIDPSDNRESPFYKNGLLIRPNANQVFGSGLDRLFYYTEVYGADNLASTSGNYSVFTYIAEANVPQPMPEFQKRSARKLASPDVLVGQFDISTLPSGSYFLRLAILNDNNEAVAEQSRKFFIYNPRVVREAPTLVSEESFEMSKYAQMPEEDVDQAERRIQIIASDSDRRRMRGIEDLDERRRFLMDFWSARDPNPQTPINEFQEQFLSRVQYANDRYTTSFEEGWNTDRGRTLIKYGPPTAIEPHLFDRGYIPYEIWQYNNIPGEGQSQFIFADRDGFGMFELIHSTVPGERHLVNWQEELVES